jgi:hypothetical protein
MARALFAPVRVVCFSPRRSQSHAFAPGTECIKSAKGNLEACNCVYEGGAVARTGTFKKRAKKSSIGPGPAGYAAVPTPAVFAAEKRSRESSEGAGSDDDEMIPVGVEGDDSTAAGTGPRKRQAAGAGQRVETLVDRISEPTYSSFS